MSIAGFSVRRPVFVTMATLIVIILGAVSLMRIPVDLMPDITYPTLSIRTTYENASPQEIELLVSRPIEEAVAAVPGVDQVTSVSSEGVSNVRATFTWGTDIDAAANDIRDRLDRVTPNLPEDADRPMLLKFDLASFPVLILGAYSNLDPVRMREIIDTDIKQRVERVPGVAALDVWGGLEREIHVDLNPDKVKALDIPLDVILARIRAANINLPAGSIDRGNFEVTIRTPGEYTSVDQIGDTVVALRGGAPIYLREIAVIQDSWRKVRQIVRVNGQPGVRLGVRKQSGTNTVQVAGAAMAEIERINHDIPQIHIVPIIDTSDYIKRSISNVGTSAVLGGALAVVILLLFLRSFRSTIIIATSIPVSIIATFSLMYFNGFTLNMMTLGGLALGVGMLVDNSIVVLENIYRLREGGLPARDAAINGTGEVITAIVASTLTTLVVFLPLIFVRGMAGVMFKQLSLVVSFSLLCSLVTAVTLVPMLTSRLLHVESTARVNHESVSHIVFRVGASVLNGIESAYKGFLHWALDRRWRVLGAVALLFAATVALFPLIGAELMPTTDEGEVRISTEMAVGTRIDLSNEMMKRVEQIVEANVPEMKSLVSSIGGSGWRGGGPHNGELRIALKPLSQRKRSSEQIANALRGLLKDIPGMTVRTRAGQGLFILRMSTSGNNDRVQVDIRGNDLQIADELAHRVEKIIQTVEGVTDTQISRESGTPEEIVHIDRHKAASLKVTVNQIAEMLQTVLSGTRASYYREAGDEYQILVKVRNAEKMDLREILDLTVTNSDGQPVVLRNLVSTEAASGPVFIERKDQERVITISANITGRDMGSIIKDIRARLAEVPMPKDFSIDFAGDYEEQQKAFRELLLSFVLALVLVYMVMACQYESLRDPFVVMFSVPLAVIGVDLTLFLTNTTFNIQSFIGCIMLGGIVVNNAILLVDHTNLLRRRDAMGLREAIEEAGRRRLRPILMTALTTILGLLPLALGLGEGGEAQAPLARAVIGGLTSSTVITLVVVPVVYSVFERRNGRRRTDDPSASPEGAEANPPGAATT